MDLSEKIVVSVLTSWLEEHSDPEESLYAFAYDITIRNHSDQPVKLISRHWYITDGESEVEEVKGPGVLGKQPLIQPGEKYYYSSGVALPTPVGSMRGYYVMQAEDSTLFHANIPIFTLAAGHHLN
ncbi:MAG: Co2+/Mg2+ efflux protein ApaG [Oceanospirillaceae bacterium]|nr:Co2+/Mg2+ efflux protein ApaG [Oceanospirillaceae bacterium]